MSQSASGYPAAPTNGCDLSAEALKQRVRDLEQQLELCKRRLQAVDPAAAGAGAPAAAEAAAGDGDVGMADASAPCSTDAPGTAPEGVSKEVDFAQYFCTYGFLYHQKEMLGDDIRMRSFFDAVMGNRDSFQGKTVLDVGTGTGILAIWAAKAGARKVYAVEFTDMARHALSLVAANGLADKVEIMRGSMEELQLPEKVDIIISEWMGYFLLREAMLDSVLIARDRWLKPGGALYPSHARMMLAAVPSNFSLKQHASFDKTMEEWAEFVDSTRDTYGVDMSILTDAWTHEHQEYFMETAQYVNAPRDCLVSQPATLCSFDLHTMTLDDAKKAASDFVLQAQSSTASAGMLGWFEVDFRGSSANPAKHPVTLSTGPEVGTTHWGQQQFPLYPPLALQAGDQVRGHLRIQRRESNYRMIAVEIDYAPFRQGQQRAAKVTGRFNVD